LWLGDKWLLLAGFVDGLDFLKGFVRATASAAFASCDRRGDDWLHSTDKLVLGTGNGKGLVDVPQGSSAAFFIGAHGSTFGA